MSNVRLRRLQADFEKLQAFVMCQPRVRLIQAEGQPPERYQLEYHVRSLRQIDGELKTIDRHLVEVLLPRNYPRTPPQCRMLTPVFHPNIAPHAICIGDHWSAGESLQSMVARIGEMIAYQSYNTKSPLNGEAARWVDENKGRLPLDPAPMNVEATDAHQATPTATPVAAPADSLMPPPLPTAGVPIAPASPAPPNPPVASIAAKPAGKVTVQCSGCGTRYAVAPTATAREAECKKCQTTIPIPAAGPA